MPCARRVPQPGPRTAPSVRYVRRCCYPVENLSFKHFQRVFNDLSNHSCGKIWIFNISTNYQRVLNNQKRPFLNDISLKNKGFQLFNSPYYYYYNKLYIYICTRLACFPLMDVKHLIYRITFTRARASMRACACPRAAPCVGGRSSRGAQAPLLSHFERYDHCALLLPPLLGGV